MSGTQPRGSWINPLCGRRLSELPLRVERCTAYETISLLRGQSLDTTYDALTLQIRQGIVCYGMT